MRAGLTCGGCGGGATSTAAPSPSFAEPAEPEREAGDGEAGDGELSVGRLAVSAMSYISEFEDPVAVRVGADDTTLCIHANPRNQARGKVKRERTWKYGARTHQYTTNRFFPFFF